jgi:putative hydrolase of the HAD superfamily
MPEKFLAILLDSGDTLVDEATEIRDASGIVIQASLIPGAVEMVRALKARGYRLGLVADGFKVSFENILGGFGLYDLFDARAISDQVGVEKPHPLMFHTALEQLGIPAQEYGRVMMVGNHLARDIHGANALGIVSVWLDWSPRRPKTPACDLETPRYTIKAPLELLALLDRLEDDPPIDD